MEACRGPRAPASGRPKIGVFCTFNDQVRGATVANEAAGGGVLRGQLMTPAVIDRVTPEMRLFHEEQFGPVVPVARWTDVSDVQRAIKEFT